MKNKKGKNGIGTIIKYMLWIAFLIIAFLAIKFAISRITG